MLGKPLLKVKKKKYNGYKKQEKMKCYKCLIKPQRQEKGGRQKEKKRTRAMNRKQKKNI